MFLKTLTVTALVLGIQVLGAAVNSPANPLEAGKNTPKCKDGKKQSNCLYDSKGHVELDFADGKINYGNITMANVVDHLRKKCQKHSVCNDEIRIPSFFAQAGTITYLQQGDIVLKNIESIYKPESIGHMLDALQSSLTSWVNATYRNYQGLPRDDADKRAIQEPDDKCQHGPHNVPCFYIPQYIAPKKITFTIPNSKDYPRQIIAFEAHQDIFPEGGDFCGELGTIASGVGGALALDPETAPFGFALSLLGLACSI